MQVDPTGDVGLENSSSRTSHDHREVIATMQSFAGQPIRCDTTRVESDSLLSAAHSYRHHLLRSPVVRDQARCSSCRLLLDDFRESIASSATDLQHHELQVPCGRNHGAGHLDCR